MTEAIVGPHLDRDGDTWTATLPGVGSITIGADHEVRVSPDDAALRWGWAEPLSLLHRGFCLAQAGIVSDECAVLVFGSSRLVEAFLPAVATRGWGLLADDMTPVSCGEGDFIAYPRQAPIIMSQSSARKADLEGERLHEDSDAVAVKLPRHETPATVAGLLILVEAQAGETLHVRRPAGREKLRATRRRLTDWRELEPPARVRRDMGLAGLPLWELRTSRSALPDAVVLWQTTWEQR